MGLFFAKIERENLNIIVYLNNDGTAHVIEQNKYFIEGNHSITQYQSILRSFETKNDLAFWSTTIGKDAPTFHVDPGTGRSNVVIAPSDIYIYSIYSETARAYITVEYDIGIEKTENQSTGVFIIKQIKPRTNEYVLNTDAIRFEKNEYGDVFLPDNTGLEFILPNEIVLTAVRPFPASLEERNLPRYDVGSLRWENEVHLARFSIVFQKEDRLDEEMMNFFSLWEKKIVNMVTGPEGWAVVLICVIIIVSYIAIQNVKRKSGE
jgi:hypothetical protein